MKPKREKLPDLAAVAARAERMTPIGAPQPVHVAMDAEGRPLWVGQPGERARRVELVRDRWRIQEEWWREEIAREYWSVLLDGGALVTVFRDAVTGRWYEQRYG